MVLFPNCKINLGLRVTGKRTDGYHDIETIFYPIALRDAAEIITFPTISALSDTTGNFELVITGLDIPGESSGNLCRKAWELIKTEYSDRLNNSSQNQVRMYLHKTIPIGAGLGGGSSDGAYTLLLLNKKLGLNLSEEQLKNLALKLGSDCPFFILNKPCVAMGRGEQMNEISVPLDDYYFALIDAGIHISTAWSFGKINIAPAAVSLTEIIQQPVEQWKDQLINDFEKPVFDVHPALKEIKETLYGAGAAYASMTGTGSCVYGIFNKKHKPDLSELKSQYKVYMLKQNH